VQEIVRLRIGIDRPSSQSAVIGYVLGNFTEPEKVTINRTIDDALIALLSFVEKRMNLNEFELTKLIEQVGYEFAMPDLHAKSGPLRESSGTGIGDDLNIRTEPLSNVSRNTNMNQDFTDATTTAKDVNTSESGRRVGVAVPRSNDPSPER